MSKADKMFEELGYQQGISQIGDLFYYKDDENIFYFRLDKNSISKSGYYDDMCDDVTINELQAINEKVKELGWLQ